MQTVNVLAQIQDGMTVYDFDGESIGTVNYVQMSDELPDKPGPETEGTTAAEPYRQRNLLDDIAEVFVDDDGLPVEVKQRLLHEGFIRIDVGILNADRYATPDQIASVSDEDVHLNVNTDELILRG